ncbi:MAG: hypothetical protein PF445_11825 [Melioribacteraceae bacterium]|jgi:hypothetical protein|nr:hypothetical protein [Melioribacteraceae bacterium]
MIKRLLILLLISSAIFGQYSPRNFELGVKQLSKTVASPTPESNSIQDIIANDDFIIIGTSRGLSLSEDNGENWTNFYNTGPFGDDGTTAIGYDNDIIWATTGQTTEVNGENLPEGTGIKYSSDFGVTWTSIAQPTDDSGDSSIVYGINTLRALPVTTKIYNISYDIAFTKNTVWISSFAGGLRKSSDMGVTWERVVLPPDTLDSISPNDTLDFTLQPVAGAFGDESWLNHRVFSVLGVDDSTLYVGTAGGINKSTDNGISWTKFSHKNQTNPISGNFVVGLGYNEADNSIWAATWKSENLDEYWAVSHSADGGENWSVSLPNEYAHNFGFKYLGGGKSHVFVPTDRGIYRSKDDLNTWLQPTLIKDSYTNIPIVTNIFYASATKQLTATDYHIWVGSNNGLSRLSETNGFWEGDWKVFIASNDVKLDETYAFPNPFSPAQELVKIKYALSSDAEVTIRIMNFGMELVRTLIQNTQRGTGEQLEFWDGRDELGSTVTNGVYFYRIDSDVLGEPLFGKIMVLK